MAIVKLNAGPNVKRFAEAIESTVEDVLQWANGQITDPMSYYAKEYPNQELRLKAIKDYMLYVIEYDKNDPAKGINERMKSEPDQTRQPD